MSQGVIEFDRVSKVYPGATAPAVSNLSFTVGSGEICALVGPSGSGKTTVMRMVNRLHEPTSGEIRIDGVSNRSLPAEELRRRIGYVIQAVGLFPHQSIADNVATVPRLLGWPEARTRSRVDELLRLVGLDPATYGDRFPSQLSGGQRQRVGVARALAADPPVMLMDEPFGAIDPVVRTQIQDEFLRLQQHVRKTIIIVTHDIDEAIRMGDRIAVLKEGGVLAQVGTPQELLARPNSEFVARFIGSDSGIKQLGLLTVRDTPIIPLADAARQGFALYVDAAGRPAQWADGTAATPCVRATASLRDALGDLLVSGALFAPVVDDAGRPLGVISIDVIRSTLARAGQVAAAFDDAGTTRTSWSAAG